MDVRIEIKDLVNDITVNKDGFATVTEAKDEAQQYVFKNKVDAAHCQNLGRASDFVQTRLLMIDIFKCNKKYATYYWVPLHPRYEPHLVMRGGYFRKVQDRRGSNQ